jgi:hypothetical protein
MGMFDSYNVLSIDFVVGAVECVEKEKEEE